MRVARLHGIRDLRCSVEAVPTPEPGHELVRVTAVGLCGSDLHWFTEGGIGGTRIERPLVPGHEFAGAIEGGPRHGLRVAVDPAVPCNDCATCQRGDRNLCPTVAFAGHSSLDGALQEYVVWPSTLLHPLPDALSAEDGAMLEPLGVALHALDLGHVRVGCTVEIVGAGPIGLLLVQAARRAGATRVVVVEPLAHRREASLRLGADVAMHPDEASEENLLVACGAGGADVAFDVAGTEGAVDSALRAARPGARIVLAGIPAEERTSFPAALARRKGLTLVLARRMADAYPRAVRMVQHGLIDVRSIVTQRFLLDQVDRAFSTAAARDGLKVIVQPG